MKDSLLPFTFARDHGVAVEKGGVLWVRHDSRESSWREARRAIGEPLRIQECSSEGFLIVLERLYAVSESKVPDLVLDDDGWDPQSGGRDLLESDAEAPIIALINSLVRRAVQRRASDIHFEPFEDRLRVRFRIDGVLTTIVERKMASAIRVVSRLKVMAQLDIAEKRLPQDGRIALTFGGRNVDVRLSTLPGPYGERVALRLLDRRQSEFTLESISLSEEHLEWIRSMIEHRTGIILITGPTGSGKTTTLYAIMRHLNQSDRNILTVEDPVEYDLPGIGQTQINPEIGMTFARSLRAILRQDPDIVLVGEIRDSETAQIAAQASLTGHLVLSTLHTNSAAGAITRLRDLEVASFLLSATLRGIVAQRLVRRLCLSCRRSYPLSERDRETFLQAGVRPPSEGYTADGCDDCGQIGYRGRIALYEIVIITEEIAALIHKDASEQEIRACCSAESLLTSGLKAVIAGTNVS